MKLSLQYESSHIYRLNYRSSNNCSQMSYNSFWQKVSSLNMIKDKIIKAKTNIIFENLTSEIDKAVGMCTYPFSFFEKIISQF